MAKKAKAAVHVVRMVGDSRVTRLDAVKPNPWNPNEMDDFTKASLKRGFEEDGWVASQPLLIWGKDEKKRPRNVIIDGEHRWMVAIELGYIEAPMVFLDDLTEAQAKALTIKMNQKKGRWNEEKLSLLVRDIRVQYPSSEEDLSLSLGIEQESMMALLAMPDQRIPAQGPEGSTAGIPSSGVRMVHLSFDEKTHPEFTEAVRRLATEFKTKNVTDTVLEAVRRASRTVADK